MLLSKCAVCKMSKTIKEQEASRLLGSLHTKTLFSNFLYYFFFCVRDINKLEQNVKIMKQ